MRGPKTGKNVMLPLSLLERIIELLDGWNVFEYNPATRYEYDDILWALKVKIQKLELREAYGKIILADDEDAGHSARIRYLQERRQLEISIDGDADF